MDGRGSADILLFEGFRLDRRGGVLYRLGQGAPVALGPRALGLLGLLAAWQGRSRGWSGREGWSRKSNLNVQIAKLRHILDQNRDEGSCIQTLAGRGYSFVAPVTRPDVGVRPAVPAIPQGGTPPRPPHLN